MRKEAIITILLLVLVLVSGVQAYQLTTLSSQLDDVSVGTTNSATSNGDSSSSGGSSGGNLPSNLQSLPNMVGGC